MSKRFPVVCKDSDGSERVVGYRADIENRMLDVTLEKAPVVDGVRMYYAYVKNEYNSQRRALTEGQALALIDRLDELFTELESLGVSAPRPRPYPGKVCTHF